MKNLFCLLIINFIVTAGFSQDVKVAMAAAVAEVKNANDPQALKSSVNTFDRISKTEQKEWLPLYYKIYAGIRLAQMEKDAAKKDLILDGIKKDLDQLKALQASESEVVVLEGYWNLMKLSVDPAGRGQTLAPSTTALFEKAVQINPSNPRAQMMLGQMQYGTASFFKTSTEEACKTLQSSIPLFEKQSDNELWPSWGKEHAMMSVRQCEQQSSVPQGK